MQRIEKVKRQQKVNITHGRVKMNCSRSQCIIFVLCERNWIFGVYILYLCCIVEIPIECSEREPLIGTVGIFLLLSPFRVFVQCASYP